MRVALFGAASGRGRRAVRDLLDRSEITHIQLLGPASDQLAQRLVDPPIGVDPGRVGHTLSPSPASLAGVHVAVGCLDEDPDPLAADRAAVALARAAGVPYVSTAGQPEIVAALLATTPAAEPVAVAAGAHGTAPVPILDGEARPPVAIVGMNWTPGLSALLAAAAVPLLEHVTTVKVAWSVGRSDEGAGRYIDALLRRLDGAGLVRGVTGEAVFFPEPVGWQRAYPVAGGEAACLAGLLPNAAFTTAAGVAGGSSVGLARLAGGAVGRRLAGGLTPLAARGGGWTALRVDVAGRWHGADRVVTYGVVDNLANLESATLLAACLLVGRGDVMPGSAGRVVSPGGAFAPQAFLAALVQRGVRVAHLER